jgi:hypothetical protein
MGSFPVFSVSYSAPYAPLPFSHLNVFKKAAQRTFYIKRAALPLSEAPTERGSLHIYVLLRLPR